MCAKDCKCIVTFRFIFFINVFELYVQTVRVPHHAFDVLGLMEEAKVSLLTAKNTGKFLATLQGALAVQRSTDIPSSVTAIGGILDFIIVSENDKVIVTKMTNSPFVITEPLFEAFLGQADDDDDENVTVMVTTHIFAPYHVAVSVFALTIVCLLMAYTLFMARACRVRANSFAENLGKLKRSSSLQSKHTVDTLNSISSLAVSHNEVINFDSPMHFAQDGLRDDEYSVELGDYDEGYTAEDDIIEDDRIQVSHANRRGRDSKAVAKVLQAHEINFLEDLNKSALSPSDSDTNAF